MWILGGWELGLRSTTQLQAVRPRAGPGAAHTAGRSPDGQPRGGRHRPTAVPGAGGGPQRAATRMRSVRGEGGARQPRTRQPYEAAPHTQPGAVLYAARRSVGTFLFSFEQYYTQHVGQSGLFCSHLSSTTVYSKTKCPLTLKTRFCFLKSEGPLN
jgi:hypothetical protein